MTSQREREMYERELRREAQVSRDNANANSALFAVLFVAALAALGAALFIVGQRNTQTEAPVLQPPDVNVEVPQPQVPQVQPPEVNVQPPAVPDVNVTVPAPEAPAAPEASGTEPAPAEAPSN